MKKTLITLLALAGVAAADELTPVWSMEDINVSGNTNYPITLTDTTISSATGYTAVITLDWDTAANAPMFWLGTDNGSAYASSTATFGYDKNRHHAGLFSTGGSNGGSTDEASQIVTTLKDYKADTSDSYANFSNEPLIYFLTSSSGTSTLYGLTNNNEVVKIATQTGMVSGVVTTLHVGHWGTDNNKHAGTLNIELYQGVMEQSTMQSIAGAVTPEPATATLSLLALAGLAARRRRK